MTSKVNPILVVLPRGEAIRNFLYTGMILELKRSVPVRLLTVAPNEQVVRQLQEIDPNMNVIEDIRMPWPMRYLCKLMDLAHGRLIWSVAARERWKKRNREARGLSARLKRAVNVFIARLFTHQKGLGLLEKLLVWGSDRSRQMKPAFRLIEEVQPRWVFNASHVHCANALPYLIACRKLKIPICSFLFSWDNLTSQGRSIPVADAFIAWNQPIKDQLLAMYPKVDARRVEVTGTPQFDFHFKRERAPSRAQFCAELGLDPERPLVLYTSGMPNHMPGEPEIVEIIAQALADIDSAPQLAVRVYAKDTSGRFDGLKCHRDIHFLPVAWETHYLTPLRADCVHYTNLLAHVDVGINIASTVSLELCLFDKPVINIAFEAPGFAPPTPFARFYEFDHYRPIVESGAVDVVYDRQRLADVLRQCLVHPSAKSGCRKELLAQFFGKDPDGDAAKRVCRALCALYTDSVFGGGSQ